jgi:hypothetical protein
MKTSSILATIVLLTLAASVSAEPADPPVPVYGVRALLREANKPFGQEIVLEGFPTSVCKRGGKKAWLRDVDPEADGTIRVERTGDMRAFGQDLLGKTIRVTGILRELRLDAAYFDAWEARVRASMKEKTAGEGGGVVDCTEECQGNVAAEKVLENIAAHRKRLAQSAQGYLTAFWVDGRKWERIDPKEKR